ncbi:regulatory iron-sulfur-containing complex subunit RicT [Algoriphagus sp. A40]|uniref:regulatory iron-sulfur-containing complex subunit RicT n=1 Tax=Algoriphagus sp. A40 TaxID=1945863 RepID=UPI00098530D7|nr:Signal peptidase-like protein [Algoriphagus sp. A40]
MNSFDWLSHMGIPQVDNFDIVEIKFKGGRKEYFRNVDYLTLHTGDPVVVDVPNGHHIGYVSLQGELVRLQMQKRKVRDDDNITRIYRVATQKDMEKWEESRNREIPTLYRCKQIVDEYKLQMKMSDVEYQADNSKATFYYSAEDRVDFRELIKALAGEFKIRVEMKQISLRQEAGRLGGIGVCGRELCCSTWLVDFKNVTTSAARYQNLSLNPGKLSGQCGRLKCCLNYELDTYMDAIKDIPQVEKPLQTESGPAKLQKTDIFRKLMWFSYNNDNDWHNISCDRVREIQALNEQGIKVFNLQVDKSTDMVDLAAQSTRELELLDKKFSKKKKKKKTKNRPQGENPVADTAPKAAQPSKPGPPKAQQGRPQPGKPQNRQNVSSGAAPQPKAQEIKATERPEAKEGIEHRKKKNKNRNRPKPGPNQAAGPKPENQSNKPTEVKQEGNRKFPPRRNQGPNNGGNE